MTKTSEPSLSTAILSSTSIDAAVISPMATSASIVVLTPVNSPTQAAIKPTQATSKATGAIVGAVVGGILGFLILAALLLFLYRRRNQRRRLARRLNILRYAKPDLPSVPFSKKALFAAEGRTPSEISNSSAAGSRHNRLGNSSLDHYYFTGHQSPDNSLIQHQSMGISQSLNTTLVPVSRAAHNEQEVREVQHIDRSHSPSTSKSSTREEVGLPDGTKPSWNPSPRPMGRNQIKRGSSDALDIDKMDPETREQRRDALLEQMRRVLDGEQDVGSS
ncbi:hypothetical protein C0995_000720 [Termitomyces sp. Mi166|nr:hypothetical protein C0995_000720 [Termitomyces sp. Mi166\